MFLCLSLNNLHCFLTSQLSSLFFDTVKHFVKSFYILAYFLFCMHSLPLAWSFELTLCGQLNDRSHCGFSCICRICSTSKPLNKRNSFSRLPTHRMCFLRTANDPTLSNCTRTTISGNSHWQFNSCSRSEFQTYSSQLKQLIFPFFEGYTVYSTFSFYCFISLLFWISGVKCWFINLIILFLFGEPVSPCFIAALVFSTN